MAIPELKDSKDRLTDCIYFGDPLSASVGSGFVPTSRTISTSVPLGGGGSLVTNRTLTISNFAGSAAGAVPPSTGGVVKFLRADGGWEIPPTFGAAVGYVPASLGGTTNYLRADGTWASPAGTGISGLTAGLFPVAASATAISNGRIGQITDGIRLFSAYTTATDFKSIQVVRDNVNGRFSLTPFDYDAGVTTFLTPLFMSGQGASAYLELLPESLVLAGAHKFPEGTSTLTNGVNATVTLPSPRTSPWVRAVGPTAAFSIGGFTKTVSAATEDSEILYLYNTTSQAMTILNENAGTAATSRIWTGTGGNVILPAAYGVTTFIYSETDSRWVLASSNPVVQYPRTLGYVPYQNAAGNLADSTLFHDSANNRYGFATATPKATVDVNGTLATRSYNQVLVAGLNSNIPAPTASFMRVTGPGGAFSIGGIVPPSGANGTRLTISSAVSQAMTIVNNDLSSTLGNRIGTGIGANITFPAEKATVSLIYDSVDAYWRVESIGAIAAGGVNTNIQVNSNGILGYVANFTYALVSGGAALTMGNVVLHNNLSSRELNLGTPVAAAVPGAEYAIHGNSVRGGYVSNQKGGALKVGGGSGTGTGGGGNLALQTARPLTTGNTQNPYVDRVTYVANPVPLTDSTDTLVLTVGVPTGTGSGGTLWYTIYCTDLTDMQIRRGRVEWGAVNKAGTVTPVLGTPEEVDCTPTGTLTVTVTAVDTTTNGVAFKLNAVSSLTPPAASNFVAWITMAHDGTGAIS